jgi:hypothetical protein
MGFDLENPIHEKSKDLPWAFRCGLLYKYSFYAPRSKTLRTESAASGSPTKHANIAHTGAHGELPLHFQNKKKEILFKNLFIGLLCYFG